MAIRKPLFLDDSGFPTEMSPGSDSLGLDSITVNGTSGITLVSGTIAGVPIPGADTQLASKSYVDSVANGLTPKQPTRVTTSGVDLADHVGGASVTYSAVGGAGGTGQFTNAPTVVDGVTLAEGDRILVKDQGGGLSHVQNGVYVATATTSTWDRAVDFDENGEVLAGSSIYVTEGTLNADSIWFVVSDNPLDLNVHAIEWSKFSGASQIVAGNGISKSGDTLSVDAGVGVLSGPSGLDLDLDTAADASGAGFGGGSAGLEFDTSGDAGKLRLAVEPAGGVFRDSSGISIKLDETVDTLDVDADGLKVSGVPAAFKVNGVATATVTASGLSELTDGNETSLHSHGVIEEAKNTGVAYSNTGGVAAGQPVYFALDDTVSAASARDSSGWRVFGLAKEAATAGQQVTVISDGPLAGVLTGVDGGPAAAGDLVYLSDTKTLTLTRPTGNGRRITVLGTAINSSDMYVEVNYLGRIAGSAEPLKLLLLDFDSTSQPVGLTSFTRAGDVGTHTGYDTNGNEQVTRFSVDEYAYAYDANLTNDNKLGLYVHPPITNVLVQSQTFNTSPWFRSGGSFAGNVDAPDGTLTAFRYTGMNSGNFLHQQVTIGAFVSSNFSIWYKGTMAGELVIANDGNATLTSIPLPTTNLWTRINVSEPGTHAGNNKRYRVLATGSGEFSVWGGQVTLNYPDTVFGYVGTGSSGVTTGGSMPSIPGAYASGLIDHASGTVRVKYIPLGDTHPTGPTVASIARPTLTSSTEPEDRKKFKANGSGSAVNNSAGGQAAAVTVSQPAIGVETTVEYSWDSQGNIAGGASMEAYSGGNFVDNYVGTFTPGVTDTDLYIGYIEYEANSHIHGIISEVEIFASAFNAPLE